MDQRLTSALACRLAARRIMLMYQRSSARSNVMPERTSLAFDCVGTMSTAEGNGRST